MFCQSQTLVKVNGHEHSGTVLRCRSWGCADCGPRRQAALAKDIKAGKPNTFITLTVNPAVGSSPDERMAMLADAWRRVRRKARKVWANDTLEFFAVVEATEAGEPHLHIAARCQWIGQRWLSEQMDGLIGAPVVNIQRIKSRRKLSRYLAKYLSKGLTRFGTAKRYWRSHGYLTRTARQERRDDLKAGYWHRADQPLDEWAWWKRVNLWVQVAIDPVTFRPPGQPP